MKRMFCETLPKQIRLANQMRYNVTSLKRFSSAIASSSTKPDPSVSVKNEGLPLVLQRLGVGMNDSLSAECIDAFRRRPIPSADANAISALRRLGLFKSARLYAYALSCCGTVPPLVHLELCRLLASIYLEGKNTIEDTSLLEYLNASLECSPLPIKPTASLLLQSCSNFSQLPAIPPNTIQRNDVIACLLGRTLHDAHAKLFALLLESEREYPIFHSKAVLSLMASRAAKTPSLANILLERIIDERCAPNASNAQLVLDIVRASGVWNVSEKTAISPKGMCDVCNNQLNPREALTVDEHSVLHYEFLRLVQERSGSFTSGSPAEVRALINHVHKLPKAEGAHRCLVIDTLNLIHGRPTEPFYKMLLVLLERFPKIMLITRPGAKNKFIRHLTTLNISVFVCNKQSEDDLFVLLAALEMGPQCFVLTNDQFTDHRQRLDPEVRPLFDKWTESRTLRYFQGTTTTKMPEKFTSLPHRTKNGCHIPVARVISPSIYEQDWICVTKKKRVSKK